MENSKGMDAEELLRRYQSGTRDFRSIILCEANLSRVNLSQANFSQAILSITNFSGSDLSEVNLSQAKLNVAKLSGANLTQADLSEAILNVANLIRADLSQAILTNASLIRSELVRANLSHAIGVGSNLSEADLRETSLRQANFYQANLKGANFRDANLVASNLERTNLHAADLSRADLRGANLCNAELRQANLSQANLSGANLRGANFRWADLNGANLTGANLEQAKLSGASLYGANLSYASLLNSVLIHADLTQAQLTGADLTGAELTGAALTGAKLYEVSRFGVKAEEITCDWVDLSPNGDRTQVLRFTPQQAQLFFNAVCPQVEISVDASLDLNAHCALANAYRYLLEQYPVFNSGPSIDVSSRRTVISFRVDTEEQLLLTAYIVILPFKDATYTQGIIKTLVQMLQPENYPQLSAKLSHQLIQLGTETQEKIQQLGNVELPSQLKNEIQGCPAFFQSPTRTILKNFQGQSLKIYSHPQFGRSLLNVPELLHLPQATEKDYVKMITPSLEQLIDFLKRSDSIEINSKLN